MIYHTVLSKHPCVRLVADANMEKLFIFIRCVVFVTICANNCYFFQLCTLFIITTFMHRDESGIRRGTSKNFPTTGLCSTSQCYTGTVTGRRLHRGL